MVSFKFGTYKKRNNLKRPETTYRDKKRLKTTYSDLQQARNNLQRPATTWKNIYQTKNNLETIYNEQETTCNDPKRVRHNLQLPKPTYSKQRKKKKKEAKRPTTNNRFSSLTRFQPNIWSQSSENCFTENHGQSRAPNISILSCVFYTGYKIYGILMLRNSLTLVN